jgi:hypothetical protein
MEKFPMPSSPPAAASCRPPRSSSFWLSCSCSNLWPAAPRRAAEERGEWVQAYSLAATPPSPTSPWPPPHPPLTLRMGFHLRWSVQGHHHLPHPQVRPLEHHFCFWNFDIIKIDDYQVGIQILTPLKLDFFAFMLKMLTDISFWSNARHISF